MRTFNKFLLQLALLFACASVCTAQSENSVPYKSLFSFSQLQTSGFEAVLQHPLQLIVAGDSQQSLKELEKIHTRFKTELLVKAIALLQKGEHANAIQLLESYLKEHPASADAKFFLGLANADSGDLSKALQLLDEASWFGRSVAAPPLAIQMETAHLLIALGNKDKASDLLKKLGAQNPDNIDLSLQIAALKLEQGNKEEAITEIKKVLAVRPADSQANLIYAKALLLALNRANSKEAAEESVKTCEGLLKSNDLSEQQIKEVSITKLRALLAGGEIDKAELWSDKIEKKYVGDPDVLRLKQQLALEQQILHDSENQQQTKETDKAG